MTDRTPGIVKHLADKFTLQYILCFLSGVIAVLAMPPWNLWPMMFVGLSFFYILLSIEHKTRRADFWKGWLFGFGYALVGLYWIGNALLVEGNGYSWAYPFAVAGIPLVLGVFTGLATFLFKKFFSTKLFSGFIAFVAIMAIAEYARGHLFTGFPWNLYGYGWSSLLSVAQTAAIFGIYGLTLLTLFWCSLPGYLLISYNYMPVKITIGLLAFSLFLACFSVGYIRLESHPEKYRDDIAIRLVQPNIKQENKWDPALLGENLKQHLQLSTATDVNQLLTTIIIWPETALNDFIMQHDSPKEALKSVMATYKAPVYLATGYLRQDDQGNHHNSLVVFDRELNVGAVYDKSHLVPFGEYIPFQELIPITPITNFKGFQNGDGPSLINIKDRFKFSPLICYEIIFPGNSVDHNQERPEWIINVTNDAWYGKSAGPYQHFMQARFRAIEQGISVIRSANTGISGVIDPYGRIVRQTDLFEQSGHDVAVPITLKSPSLYASFGDIPFIVTSILMLAGALFTGVLMPNKKSIAH